MTPPSHLLDRLLLRAAALFSVACVALLGLDALLGDWFVPVDQVSHLGPESQEQLHRTFYGGVAPWLQLGLLVSISGLALRHPPRRGRPVVWLAVAGAATLWGMGPDNRADLARWASRQVLFLSHPELTDRAIEAFRTLRYPDARRADAPQSAGRPPWRTDDVAAVRPQADGSLALYGRFRRPQDREPLGSLLLSAAGKVVLDAAGGPEVKALRSGRYKYLAAFTPPGGERSGLGGELLWERLFDLRTDPSEQDSLHGADRALLDLVRGRLREHFRELPVLDPGGSAAVGLAPETEARLRALAYL